MRPNLKYALIFLTPITVVILILYAMVLWSVDVSFTYWYGILPSWKFVGLDNYYYLIQTERFWIDLKNNSLWLVLFILPTTFLGLFLAYAIDRVGRGEGVFRAIFLYPTALSFVVTGNVWAWMYDPDVGVLNTILKSLGLGFLQSRWITDPNIALYCVIGAAIWQYTGFAMIIYLSAIKGIPPAMIESAIVDGASSMQILRHVIIPQVRHATLVVTSLLAIFALRVFDLVWVMTGGGPAYSTDVLAIYMYIATFRQHLVAVGAALSVVIFLLSIVIVIPYVKWAVKRWLGLGEG